MSRPSRARWALALGVGALAVVLAAPPAAAVEVTTEAELRAAFADLAETEVVLRNDVALADCTEGDLDRPTGAAPLVVEGNGFTIAQTCPDERVLETLSGLEVRDVTITGGEATGGSGGGISVDSAAGLTVVRSTITANAADPGGGSGGGIDALGSGPTVVVDSTISANTAGDTGGGIRTFGDLTVTGSTISANTSAAGGGGIDASQGGTVTVTNSTIVANTSSSGAGGLVLDAGSITFATITGNSAPFAANLVLAETPIAVLGTVVAGAQGGGASCEAVDGGSTASGGYNAGDDGSCGFDDATDQPTVEPLLGPLAANGGPTETELPEASSPLLDVIPAAACEATGVSTDQRGVARPQNGTCDVGAVEVDLVPPTPTSTTPPPVEDGGTSPGELPRTGAATLPLGVLGVLLVAGGVALVRRARRLAA